MILLTAPYAVFVIYSFIYATVTISNFAVAQSPTLVNFFAAANRSCLCIRSVDRLRSNSNWNVFQGDWRSLATALIQATQQYVVSLNKAQSNFCKNTLKSGPLLKILSPTVRTSSDVKSSRALWPQGQNLFSVSFPASNMSYSSASPRACKLVIVKMCIIKQEIHNHSHSKSEVFSY